MTMRSSVRFLSNWLWIRLNAPQHQRFLQALEQVEEAQRQYLLRLLHRNVATEYGSKNNFADISSAEEYQHVVPITKYEDYLPYLEEIARGETGVLTREAVLLFEPSSGTSSSSKLIPYTKSLKAEFQCGIGPWIFSLYIRNPEIMKGLAYWCITPPTTQRRHYGSVPVGFETDAEYLGSIGEWLYDRTAAVPKEVARIKDVDTFMRQTLLHLLAAENLAVISVWSPTFLTLLLRKLREHQDKIILLLRKSDIPGAVKRADKVKSMLRHNRDESCFEQIWPKLSVISCWTHGPSKLYANEIRRYFPHAEIEGKGLVSTEAFITLPLLADHDPVLAINSHFFEFSDSRSGDIRLAHELEEGNEYSVIVTTGGGLYRYRLGDLVRVTGFIGQAPTLRFVAKEEAVSDLFGEKLHHEHVRRSVTAVLSRYSIEPSFFLMAPVKNKSGQVTYSLFLHAESVHTDTLKSLRSDVEKLLRENFHYAHCRNMGQLTPLRLFLIDRTACTPEEIFSREMQRRGLKLGDIKPSALDREAGWEKRFRGSFMDEEPEYKKREMAGGILSTI